MASGPEQENEKEIFVEQVGELLYPYARRTIASRGIQRIDDGEREPVAPGDWERVLEIETTGFMGIARDMLGDFYDMASEDRAMSMYMVPIKAYLKAYAKKKASGETPTK